MIPRVQDVITRIGRSIATPTKGIYTDTAVCIYVKIFIQETLVKSFKLKFDERQEPNGVGSDLFT